MKLSFSFLLSTSLSYLALAFERSLFHKHPIAWLANSDMSYLEKASQYTADVEKRTLLALAFMRLENEKEKEKEKEINKLKVRHSQRESFYKASMSTLSQRFHASF